MTLGRLTRLGRSELEDEMAKLRETIAELQSILASDTKLRGVIGDRDDGDPRQVRERRLTQIVNDPGELGIEDLIEDEEIVITMTQAGYVKSVAADAFRTQGRGGRGVQGAKLRDEDFVAPDHPHDDARATCCSSPTAGACSVSAVTRSR